jgi:hypothetical protein
MYLEFVDAQLLVRRVVAQRRQEGAPVGARGLVQRLAPEAPAVLRKRRVRVKQAVHRLVQQRAARLVARAAARHGQHAHARRAAQAARGAERSRRVSGGARV